MVWTPTLGWFEVHDLSDAVLALTGSTPKVTQFTSAKASSQWSASTTWGNNNNPNISSVLDLANNIGGSQEVVVDTQANAYSLRIQGSGGDMRVMVNTDSSLSVLTSMQVGAGGDLHLSSGSSLNTGQLSINSGGNLRGSGHIFAPASCGVNQACVDVGGTVSPGNSPGTLTITGNVGFEATGVLQIELAGTTQGTNYDLLSIAGNTTLAGTLQVSLLSDFTPQPGDTFRVLTATAISGQFSTLSLPTLASDRRWNVLYGSDALTLAVVSVPEPSTLAALSVVVLLGVALNPIRQRSIVSEVTRT